MPTPLTLSKVELRKLEEVRKRILKDITLHYTIDQLTDFAGLSNKKLKLGFKQCYGKTIYKYLEHARLERAIDLIERGGLDILEISLLIGYNYPSNFIAAFKRNFGLTPMIYKPRSEYLKDTVIQAAKIIENNLHKQHTVVSLSRTLNVNFRQFLACFKKEFGVSPYSYLQKKRMEKTKDLLEQGLTSKEIITHFGYSDVRNLDSAFKTAYGKTTSQWRIENSIFVSP